MLKTWLIGLAGLLGCLAGGCAMPMAVSEVLQQPQGTPIYTRYNLWFQDPSQLSSFNIQQGRMLPAGTQVEAVSADSAHLSIRDSQGVTYTIRFDAGANMCSMRDFIRALLTCARKRCRISGAAKWFPA